MNKTIVIIGFVLFVICFLLLRSGCKQDDLISELAEQKSTMSQLVRKYLDKDSVLHQVYTTNAYSTEYLKQSNDSVIRALRKEYGGQLKNLESRLAFQLSNAGTITAGLKDTLVMIDSIKHTFKAFSYDDRWMSLHGFIALDTVSLRYSITQDLKVDYKWDRPKWYKAKDVMVDIMSNNPNTTVGNVQSIRVVNKKKWYETTMFKFLSGTAVGFAAATQVR